MLSYATSYKAAVMAAGASMRLCGVIDPLSGSEINDCNVRGFDIAGVSMASGYGIKSDSSDGAMVVGGNIAGDAFGSTLGDGAVLTGATVVVTTGTAVGSGVV